MPPKLSAGLMLYRHGNQDDEIVLEVLLGHMGGSFWARKGDGAWSIPKGEYEPGDDPFDAAKREFEEELGSAPPLAVYRDPGQHPPARWEAGGGMGSGGGLRRGRRGQQYLRARVAPRIRSDAVVSRDRQSRLVLPWRSLGSSW